MSQTEDIQYARSAASCQGLPEVLRSLQLAAEFPASANACTRRSVMAGAAFTLVVGQARAADAVSSGAPERRWYEAAAAQKRLAESWGDQGYGAVLVLQGALVGEGPSRVVKNRDADAHAEREAVKDAQRRLGRTSLAGSVLYSTSRPCALCETAAARAGVSRMVFGPALSDAGTPRIPAQ